MAVARKNRLRIEKNEAVTPRATPVTKDFSSLVADWVSITRKLQTDAEVLTSPAVGQIDIQQGLKSTQRETLKHSAPRSISSLAETAYSVSSSQQKPIEKVIPKIIKIELSAPKGSSCWEVILQSFVGRVIECSEINNEFSAVISDRTDPTLEDEVVTIDYSFVKASDRPLISEGSIFYWNIGRYRRWDNLSAKLGPSKNHFEIRFRRLPPISKETAEKIQKVSRLIANRINAD